EWIIIRAAAVDEVNNRNLTLPLARYLTDNTPPPLLDIGSETEISLNISIYHLFGVTEELSSAVISRDDQTIWTLSADDEGNFEGFIELSPGVNEFLVSVYDRYGNGPNEAPVPLYLVYDPDDPVAVIAGIDAFTSTSFMLDGSGSYDIGPDSRLSGVVNFTWSLSFWGEEILLYGPEPGLHLSRPGPLSIMLTVTDAAGNSDSENSHMDVKDDEAPTMDGLGDLHVHEDSPIELRAKGVRDNDPLIEQVGIFLWNISGPQKIIVEGIHVEFKVYIPGNYIVVLSLTDTGGNSMSVSFNLTVLDITVPTAVAGDDMIVIKGSPVNLSAWLSSDNNPNFPQGANFTWILKGPDMMFFGMNVTFNATDLGKVRILLKVTDPSGNVDLDELLLTVVSDGVPPAVEGIIPVPDEKGIPPGSSLRLTFNEPIDLSTANSGIFLISASGLEVDIVIEPVDDRTVIVTPVRPLDRGKGYTLRITEALKDMTGEPAILQEFRYVIKAAFEILKVNGQSMENIRSSYLFVRGPIAEVTLHLSEAASPGMVMVLVDENGVHSFIGTPINDTIMVFLLEGLIEGDYYASFNGTSSTGDLLEGDNSFLVRIELKETEPTSGSDDAFPLWWVLLIIVLVLAAFAALAVFFIFRNKRRSEVVEMSGSTPNNEQTGPAPHPSSGEDELQDLTP
ncbi:MAG: Ig-like domain-containing protein, partial [Candidatus Thermoplasmatota archaeon]|nr:Ig-like domain-containing protein [Candidatus Thermoplasmatota archaeon]